MFHEYRRPGSVRATKTAESRTETVTEKLLTFALGRGVDYHDMPALRHIVQAAGKGGARWSDVILGITQSLPFRSAVADTAVERRVANQR